MTVARAMAGDYQECLETLSFFWTHGWSRRGWMAFLFLFLLFIFSRLEWRVAVATVQRRAPAHLHHGQSSQCGLRQSWGQIFAVGITITTTKEEVREKEEDRMVGKGGRNAPSSPNNVPL